MTQEPAQHTPLVTVHTSSPAAQTSPPWLAEAVLLLQVARDSGLLQKLQHQVRVPRGRMGRFEVCDFVLVLMVYAVSGEPTLLTLYEAMAPCRPVLAALWERQHLPARCTLSRFLGDVAGPATEALRELLFEDLLLHGLGDSYLGGLVDRCGRRHVLFDVDGTRQVARQRQIIQDGAYPPVRRRLASLCAPGYRGRKRGEVVRTRTTVQQAHTREWLGTFGAAGNGDAFGDLDRGCQHMVRYLTARGLEAQQGVVRLDGLYGYVRGVQTVTRHGLGYVMRAADYRLLAQAPVQAALCGPAPAHFVQPDTGTVREVFDLGPLDWTAGQGSTQRVCPRVVVTRRPAGSEAPPAVGKRQGEHILEVFVTDREAAGCSGTDVLHLYFARGGFEQTLAEEDREQDPDRWCSGHPQGQESWQLLSQWVWNVRLRLGVAAQSPPVRRTLWAPAEASPDGAPPAPAQPGPPAALSAAPPSPAPPPPASPVPPPSSESDTGQVAPATGRGSGKFGGSDFIWTPDHHLLCPAGKRLSPQGRPQVRAGRWWRSYAAKATDCAICSLASACRGAPSSCRRGRRVSVSVPTPLPPPPAQAPSPPPPCPSPVLPVRPGPQPLWWDDVPATSLRRLCRRSVHAQLVDIPVPPPLASASLPLTRAHRAHRRLTWELRLARNAHPPRTAPWPVHLHGVPSGIASYLAGLGRSTA